MIVWLNGTHGVGKTTTSVLVQRLVPGSRVLDYAGGTLVMPMTVLVEQDWREISTGLTDHAIPVRHFVLHADEQALRRRIEEDRGLVDTTHLTPDYAARRIAAAVNG